MSETLLLIFELIGTVAFAASGAIVCIGLWKFFGQSMAISGGAVVIIILRLLAAHFRWSLPKAEIE